MMNPYNYDKNLIRKISHKKSVKTLIVIKMFIFKKNTTEENETEVSIERSDHKELISEPSSLQSTDPNSICTTSKNFETQNSLTNYTIDQLKSYNNDNTPLQEKTTVITKDLNDIINIESNNTKRGKSFYS